MSTKSVCVVAADDSLVANLISIVFCVCCMINCTCRYISCCLGMVSVPGLLFYY